MKPIVLATDGSASAEQATKFAVELAREAGAKLLVVAAWEASLTVYQYAPNGPLPEVERAERHRATEAARKTSEHAKEEGVEAETVVREGDPVDIVSDTARDADASLIVVGSHGWGALRRLVFGSVSTSLLHHAPCPVLVVRFDVTTAGSSTKKKAKAVA
jgi:nucleotide-binding universal stress UspA family protein